MSHPHDPDGIAAHAAVRHDGIPLHAHAAGRAVAHADERKPRPVMPSIGNHRRRGAAFCLGQVACLSLLYEALPVVGFLVPPARAPGLFVLRFPSRL